jgi:hypothetical protein
MFATVEVRWFFEGRVPEGVAEWFRRGVYGPDEQPRRVDHYLRLGETESLGIKLREGRIEIKQRHRPHGVVRFHERAAGLVEGWRKWSLPLAGVGEGLAHALVPDSAWMAVQKERSLRNYRLGSGGQLVPVPGVAYPGQGCGAELTTVEAGGAVWWSLAFEAFGPESSLQENLVSGIEHLFAREGVPFPLDARASYGYPRWLALLQQGGREQG